MTISTWPGSPDWPEHPDYPYPPMRPVPRREGPVAVPMVDLPSGDAAERLRDRRVVLVTGALDAAAVTRAAAELMALDGRSADDVELLVNSDGGPLADVVVLLDVVSLARGRVHTTCIGRAIGTAAVLLACGTGERRASPHAVVSLRSTQIERIEGSPADLARHVEELATTRRHILAALVAATDRTEAELGDELDHGPLLDPPEARQRGLIDSVAPGLRRREPSSRDWGSGGVDAEHREAGRRSQDVGDR